MFALFIEEWAPNGPPQWAVGPKKKSPKPIVGPRTGPKAQPIRGLGWVGLWALWALRKPKGSS
jgi:hypothetical protein